MSGIAEVLANLTALLHPDRATWVGERLKSYAAIQEELAHEDPQWPDAPDLTALRLRAGRLREQVAISSPPMFRVSWDVLKASAARDGDTWIGRGLWSVTGAAGAAGPYLAWAPGRHSARRTLHGLVEQLAAAGLSDSSPPRSIATDRSDPARAESAARSPDRDLAETPTLDEARFLPEFKKVVAAIAEGKEQAFADSFGVPLSIFQEKLR